MLGKVDENCNHNWLRTTVNAKLGFFWCGHGFSFAAAQTAAAMMRAQGVHSYAARPEDLPSSATGLVGCFSRSGCFPKEPVDLLVTQFPVPAHVNSTSRVITVNSSDTMTNRWLPTRYTADAVGTVARAIGVYATPADQTFGDSGLACLYKHLILLFDEHATVARAVLGAGAEKLGPLPIYAMTVHEFGHGFHRQVWRDPGKFRICLCAPHGRQSEARDKLIQWCARVGVPVEHVTTGDANGSDGAALLACLFSLCIVDGLAALPLIHADTSPLPIELDDLRERPVR